MRAGVRDSHRSIRGDHLRFQQPRRRCAVVFGEAAEAAALDQSGNANGGAAAALNIAAGLVRHGIISLHPDCA